MSWCLCRLAFELVFDVWCYIVYYYYYILYYILYIHIYIIYYILLLLYYILYLILYSSPLLIYHSLPSLLFYPSFLSSPPFLIPIYLIQSIRVGTYITLLIFRYLYSKPKLQTNMVISLSFSYSYLISRYFRIILIANRLSFHFYLEYSYLLKLIHPLNL